MPRAPSGLDRALEWAAPVLAIALLVRLAGFAAGARFTSDECFHAGMSEWIAAHGTLPVVVKGLYSDFKYFYPPLLHLIGGFADRLFGPAAFRWVNVALLAGLLAGTWFGLSRLASRAAAALAVLALVSYPGLVLQGVRMYVECLSAALAVGSVLALIAVGQRPDRRRAILLGVLAGLGVLAKQSGLVMLAVLGALALLALGRKQRAHAAAFALALGVACVLALPFWVRNALLFGSPVYPVFGRDLDARLLHLNVVGFTPGYARFLTAALHDAGGVVLVLFAAGLGIALATRRHLTDLLLAGGALLLALAPRVPMLDSRHAIPLIAALVVLAAATLTMAVEYAPAVRRALLAVLVAWAAWSVGSMHDLRSELNPAGSMDEVWRAIRANVPAGATILAIQTYDTFYYTGRSATWPIPWGQAHPPIEMFDDREPESILAHLRQHRIDWLLLPTSASRGPFNSANFPELFMRGVQKLGEQGQLDVAWASRDLALLRVRPGRPLATPRP